MIPTDQPGPPPAGLPAPVKGALWMVAAAFLFATMTALIRHTANEMHPFQMMFFRFFFGLLLMTPVMVSSGFDILRTRRHGLYLLRATTSTLGGLCWFSALALIPIDQATALSFTMPLFATIGAALFLGEVVRARRWTAIALGFAGCLIIIRPGLGHMQAATLLPIINAAAWAFSMLLIRSVRHTEHPNTIVLYLGLYMTPISLVPALFFWDTPSAPALVSVFLVAVAATGAHICLARALGIAEASQLASFDFCRLPFAAVLGLALFGELMDGWSWVGAGVILASTLYVVHREAAPARATER